MNNQSETVGLVLSDSVYNKLRWFVLIAMPALASFYFGLDKIWGLWEAENVVGTIALIEILIGALLGLSSKAYYNSEAPYDGDMVVHADENVKTFTLDLSTNPDAFEHQDSVVFKIVND